MLNIAYPIPFNDRVLNYNDIWGFKTRIYFSDLGKEVVYNFKTAKEAFDKFLELREQFKTQLDDHPGGPHGERWITWQNNSRNFEKEGVQLVELTLYATYNSEIDEYRWGRHWIPPVYGTIWEEFKQVIPKGYPMDIYDVYDSQTCDIKPEFVGTEFDYKD